jgi:RimJ/RimL family protein N-acetyltransferase
MDTRNEASYRLAESLGFVRVEKHEAVEHGHGIIADEYVYELTFRPEP